MKRILNLITAAVLLLALLLPAYHVFAKGPPSKVVIMGSGLAAPVEITDAEKLEAFAFGQFELYNQPVELPEGDLGPSYVVSRFMQAENGEMVEFDRLLYYPPAVGHNRGIVFYEGFVDPASDSEYEDHWYAASEAADAAMTVAVSGLEIDASRTFDFTFATTFLNLSPLLVIGLVTAAVMLVVALVVWLYPKAQQ